MACEILQLYMLIKLCLFKVETHINWYKIECRCAVPGFPNWNVKSSFWCSEFASDTQILVVASALLLFFLYTVFVGSG
jgi:hypothetical protein